jgi:hypothetical protein
VTLPLAGHSGHRDGSTADAKALIRIVAVAVSVLVFAVTLVLWARFDASSAAFQFAERHAWIPAFGIDYSVGIDGISLFLVVLTGFLTPLALLSSWESVHDRVKAFSMCILALETAMIGVFVSLDLFLFYIFWDAMLIPMYFLIGIWGYDRRVYAALKFILYTLAGSVLMLVAILAVAYHYGDLNGGTPSFDLLKLYEMPIPGWLQFWGFLAFAVAFAIKVPLFPVPHLAAGRSRAGTHGRVRHSRRRPAENGNLRPGAFCVPVVPRCRAVLRAVHRGSRGDRHHLRRARRHGAAGPQEAGGVLEREPPGVRGAWHCGDERPGRAGRRAADAESRRQHRRALSHRGDAVGPPAHAADFRVRGAEACAAEALRGVPHRHPCHLSGCPVSMASSASS